MDIDKISKSKTVEKDCFCQDDIKIIEFSDKNKIHCYRLADEILKSYDKYSVVFQNEYELDLIKRRIDIFNKEDQLASFYSTDKEAIKKMMLINSGKIIMSEKKKSAICEFVIERAKFFEINVAQFEIHISENKDGSYKAILENKKTICGIVFDNIIYSTNQKITIKTSGSGNQLIFK